MLGEIFYIVLYVSAGNVTAVILENQNVSGQTFQGVIRSHDVVTRNKIVVLLPKYVWYAVRFTTTSKMLWFK